MRRLASMGSDESPSDISSPRRDIIIGFYGCPSGYQRLQMSWIPDVCGGYIDALYQGREAEKPLVIAAGKGAGSPAWGVDPATGKGVSSYLKALIGTKLDKGVLPGRIALIGFSAGCQGGVERVLANPYDAKQVDFVCALDGAAGKLVPGASNSTSEPSDVDKGSIQTWLRFALEAAAPDQRTGVPSRCMVVTHSDIVNAVQGVASTKVTALALAKAVREELGGAVASPCIVPNGLVLRDNDVAVAERPGETWPSNWNVCMNQTGGGYCRSDIVGAWPVSAYDILGNLIIVGFDAKTQKEAQCGGYCSQPAHVFQSYWVQQAVLRHVLAPRWEFVCEHTAAESETARRGGGLVASASVVTPSTIVRRGSLRTVQAMNGLGAVESECGVQGAFSNVFTLAELDAMRTKQLLVYGGVAAALIGLAYWWRKSA